MPDTTPVIRWRRHRGGYSLWHLPVDIPADDETQTACGRRVKRRHAETGAIADGPICRNCLRAKRTEPGQP